MENPILPSTSGGLDNLLKQLSDQADVVTPLLREFDLATIKIAYYKRQSDLNEDQQMYRKAQEELEAAFLQAGVPDKNLLVFCDDDKSGALNEKFRQDYARLKLTIEEGGVAVLACIDISRLHRDSTMTQPTSLVSSLGWKNVKVLTRIRGVWKLLNMKEEADCDAYFGAAKESASERKVLRSRLMISKIESIKAGNASGGGTIPFGWGVIPAVSKYESEDGMKHYARIMIYPPHALLKIEMMREALLPHLQTPAELNRHLMSRGFAIPPFEEWARKSASRSVLRNACRKVAGKRIDHRPDRDTLSEFGAAFLVSALIEPLIIGDYRYGSGQSGHYALEKHKRMSDEMKQAPDSLITSGRILVKNMRCFALCSDNYPELPPYEEVVALWEQNVRKWSRIDLIEARKKEYQYDHANLPVNLTRCNRMERRPSRPKNSVNAWHDFVWCGNHGWDETHNRPNLHEKLAWSNHGEREHEQWFCTANDNNHSLHCLCCTWSGSVLRRILDAHIKRRLHFILNGDQEMFAGIFEQRKEVTEKIKRLQNDLAQWQQQRDRTLREYQEMSEILAAAPAPQRDKMLKAIKDKLTPILQLIQQIEDDLNETMQELPNGIVEQTEEDVRRDLTWTLERFDSLEVARKRHLISLLVDHVVVYVGDGLEAQECIILFRWSNGNVDKLVGWRGRVHDTRAWTPEEDDAIRRLWPSGCNYSEIKTALLPGRRFDGIKRQAQALRAGRRGKLRKVSLPEQAKALDSCWWERNPDVLYIRLVHFDEKAAMCTYHTAEAAHEWSRYVQTLDPGVFNGLRRMTTSCSQRGYINLLALNEDEEDWDDKEQSTASPSSCLTAGI